VTATSVTYALSAKRVKDLSPALPSSEPYAEGGARVQPRQQAWLEIVSDRPIDPREITALTHVEPSATWDIDDPRHSTQDIDVKARTSQWAFATDTVRTSNSFVVLDALRETLAPVAAAIASAAHRLAAQVSVGITIWLDTDDDPDRGPFIVEPGLRLSPTFINFLYAVGADFSVILVSADMYRD
jgi:hypothetical protein